MLSNFLCVARNVEKKNEPFVPRDKNDRICTMALYIHSYILWFSYAFKVRLTNPATPSHGDLP